MGISVEVWRARIGRNCCGGNNFLLFVLPTSKLVSGIYLSLAIILLLLVIGNIEANPGPEDFYACFICNFRAITPQQVIFHQQIHSNAFNFRFRCPLPLCQHSYDTYKCVQAHLSHHSTTKEDEVVHGGVSNDSKCAYCDVSITTNRSYMKHIKNHLKNDGLSIPCPLSSCSRANKFTSASIFSTHLSQCHPGWLQDYSNSALFQRNVVDEEIYEPYVAENDMQNSDDEIEPPPLSNDGNDRDSSSSCTSDSDADYAFDHDEVVAYIAHFYAMLEGKKIVPSKTIDSLASKLAVISEILQEKLKRDLERTLLQAGLSEAASKKVIGTVLSMDPLYNSHHVHAPGVTLLTSTRRTTYYKNKFKHQGFKEINLKKNPQDTEDKVQYVDIRESLTLMLQDPSVQKEVYESFNAPESDGSLLRDYTDGSVFRNSSTPKKRIDLLLFMDAFTCTNPLGSAKRKHKIHGMYLTLGNLKPHLRSFLTAMRLVLLVNDKSLKKSDRMYKKCFQRLLKDMKHLEEHGIDFNGEVIAVRLQFILGDNLGQHTIGGFVESFSSGFFCRFCDKQYQEFKEDVAVDKPKPRFGNWRTPESYNEDLQQQQTLNVHNYHGVKKVSPFNALDHFHVCEPRLPVCAGHDLFIGGVVDNDVRSMIDNFIAKGWFTLSELNMKVRRFKYLGKDMGNKPAELLAGSLKLGGHAVQNWTLFRLLPVLIYDQINPDDKMWRLYLLLKSIIELVCAPALSAHQVEEMRKLIKKYWRKRNVLLNDYKPKHHFFSHYPDLFLRFGPLIHLWTLAFEHRHQFFKRVAKICNNFVNLGSLLTQKHQLLQAYQNMGPMFPDRPVLSQTSLLREEVLEEDLQNFVNNSMFDQDAVMVKNLSLNLIKYRENDWLLLNSVVIADQNVIAVGQIILLVFDKGVGTAIIKQYEAQESAQFGLYHVADSQPVLSSINLNHLSPMPHPVYTLRGKLYFSLKHAFVA